MDVYLGKQFTKHLFTLHASLAALLHKKCRKDMLSSTMSEDQKRRCVMCRTNYPKNTKEGMKEEAKRLRHWVKKGKAWAQSLFGLLFESLSFCFN